MRYIRMAFPQGKKKVLTLSYDDGVDTDIRLIDIMNRHGLKGTFNINTGCFAPEGTTEREPGAHSRRLTAKEVYEVYYGSGHEVAVHALTHPFLDTLPSSTVAYEITQDKKNIENMFKTVVRGMAYPFGTWSDAAVTAIEASGIVYARTTISHHSFDLPADWLRMGATCHHRDERLGELTDKFINEQPGRGVWMFYLWGHSYEFERDGNWNIIEDFAKKTGGRDDIWYAANIEIYDYIKAYEALQISVDCNIIKNPSCTDVWVSFADNAKETICCIRGGETVILN